jgi:autotransporter translocation and assembly factor TamB
VKPRVRHLIKQTIGGLAAAFVATAAILLFLLTTEPGARFTLRLLTARLPLSIEYADVQGSLRGPLSLTGISGATPTLEFTAERLTFDWRPLQIIRGRVHLDSMHLVGVRAVLKQDTPETEEPATQVDTLEVATSDETDFELPVALVFERIQVEDGFVTVSDSISIGDINLTASGTHDDYQVEVSASLTAPQVGQAQLESSGRGTLSEFRIEDVRALALDGEVRGSGVISWQPRIEWRVALDADGLAPATLAPSPDEWPGQISLSAVLDGSLVDGQLRMDVTVDTLFGTLRNQPVTGVIRAGINGSEYSFDRVDIDWGSVRIDVAGVVNGDRLDLDFDLRAPDLAAVLPRSTGSLFANGRLAGTPSTPIISATATATAVVLDQFTLRNADARVDVDWQDHGKNEVDVRIDDLEYSNQAIDSVRLLVIGSREAHDVELAVTSQEVDVLLTASGGLTDWTWSGVLADLRVVTRSAGDWRLDKPTSVTASKNAAALEELCMIASEGDFCIGGTWESQAEWQLRSTMNELPFSLLEPLLPEALTIDGSVSGQVSASGDARTPQYVELDLEPSPGSLEYVFRNSVAALTYREAQLTVNAAGDSIRGSLSLQLAQSGSTDFGSMSADLRLSSLAELIDGISKDSFVNALTDEWTLNSDIDQIPLSLLRPLLPQALTIDGTVTGQLSTIGRDGALEDMELDLRASEGSLAYVFPDTVLALTHRDAHLTVNVEGDSLRGSLSFQVAEGDRAGFGNLSADVGLPSFSEFIDEISTEGFVAALQDEWTLNASIDHTPLALFNVFLPTGMTLAGTLDGSIDAVAAPDGTISGRLELEPRTPTLERLVGSEMRTIRFVDTRVQANAGSDGVRGEVHLAVARPDSAPHAAVSGSIALPELTRLDQPLQSQPLEATVEGGVDLSLLDELSDDLSASAGRLDIDLVAENTIGDIAVSGNFRLRGQTEVVSLGIDLRDIDIRASGSPDGDLQIEGRVSSGDGQLTIEGTSPAIPTRESPARFTIRGEDFQALRTEQISLVVSPDIEVLIGGRAVEVSGEVTVPRAMIEILEVPQTAVSPSKDVVYVGETEEDDTQPLDVTAEVTLSLGENVVFRGFGFNTHLDGTVVASDQPGRLTQGRGELVFREGIYRGYGQSLSVEPGRLVFAGPIDDPTVDVRAYRRADDGTRAGFLVGGTLKSLDVEIWSDPAKTDTDALSYVLFGRSMSQGTEADQAQAGNAAAILGGNIVAMSMASQIGLDDARIETGARQQETAFYAGKYLSPKLYVAYGVGLYEPINVLRVRYLISRKFSLQAETGTRDSGDILYRIEF